MPEIAGNRDIARIEQPQDLADVDVAVVRAAFGVAETGSVLLSDTDLHVNAVADLAQHLMVRAYAAAKKAWLRSLRR